jgi:ubiquinone/menaquinone biosynthesis C-methylase UbiE
MNRETLGQFVCPDCRLPLSLDITSTDGRSVLAGMMRNPYGTEYPIEDGVPDLTYPRQLATPDSKARAFYDGRAEDYDKYLHLTFKTHGEEESTLRNRFIDLLDLSPSSRVLEVACGTGRDSKLIADRLGPDGRLALLDISRGMLTHCQRRLASNSVPLTYCLSNACHLPFPDKSFDAIYSFGGLGEFSDIKTALAEMVRVCRVGGKIVVGDESMPPWLRHTEFAQILTTTNKQFQAEVPLKDIPVEARDLCLRWVIGGVFYLIDFRVGEGQPQGDFDFEIPGFRGGTLRTRYEGQLEGVTREAKRLAYEACTKRGVSMHQWLSEAVQEAATRQLSDGSGQSTLQFPSATTETRH